jgi:hypothetical protein
MNKIVECIVEVEGYPTYKEERRWYIEQRGDYKSLQIVAGPFKTEQEARSEANIRIKKVVSSNEARL